MQMIPIRPCLINAVLPGGRNSMARGREEDASRDKNRSRHWTDSRGQRPQMQQLQGCSWFIDRNVRREFWFLTSPYISTLSWSYTRGKALRVGPKTPVQTFITSSCQQKQPSSCCFPRALKFSSQQLHQAAHN